jgi:predicted DNA-binding transcriptional regulator YafY
MEKRTADIRWGVEQRLEFIEFKLFWEGGINRADIMKYFSVSVPQASKDLSQYQTLAPDNIKYDRSLKRYFKSDKFAPLFLKIDADRFLGQLRGLAAHEETLTDIWLSHPPELDMVRLPQRHVDAFLLHNAVEAVRERRAIEIKYQSLSERHPSPTWRWISPHAFAFDLNRWHLRAFCHLDRTFKDFLLPRIFKIRGVAPAEAPPDADAIWNETVTVTLKPNPKLNEDQRKAIAIDYGMRNDRLDQPVRLALLYYYVRRLNLSVDDTPVPANEQHVVLSNKAEVKAALQRASDPPKIPENKTKLERASA